MTEVKTAYDHCVVLGLLFFHKKNIPAAKSFAQTGNKTFYLIIEFHIPNTNFISTRISSFSSSFIKTSNQNNLNFRLIYSFCM